MWFIGPKQLFEIVTEPVGMHLAGFSIMLALSGFYYWIYAHFRSRFARYFAPTVGCRGFARQQLHFCDL